MDGAFRLNDFPLRPILLRMPQFGRGLAVIPQDSRKEPMWGVDDLPAREDSLTWYDDILGESHEVPKASGGMRES